MPADPHTCPTCGKERPATGGAYCSAACQLGYPTNHPGRPVPAAHEQAQETIAVALHDGLEYFGHETDDVTGYIAAVSDQAKKYERAMDALDALLAALSAAEERAATAETERDEAQRNADGMARAPYGEFQAMREARDEARERAVAAERENERLTQALQRIKHMRLNTRETRERAIADARYKMREIAIDALRPAAENTEGTG